MFIFGMKMAHVPFWILVASQTERKVIWDLSMDSNGDTLVLSTRICAQITQDKVLFSFAEIEIYSLNYNY